MCLDLVVVFGPRNMAREVFLEDAEVWRSFGAQRSAELVLNGGRG